MKKTKVFGIGAGVLMILLAMTPMVNSEPFKKQKDRMK
jgi:hypothetical protein